ncbi:Terpene synthase family, metal binding domain (plasmid) [Streptomyces sp. YIM 121038]|uniref:terpene synthase family protein n=1 Tax=Streptomyces sp. YIM 121038 TaxID=2136401 RepID=UPI001110E888|nr:terpene synthase family protein [Streptomyces sp. YIM 121038]QCX82517.1 Terpene synthase family, metal binding domain [Streptomyces sp. YIM 121038]
MTDKTGGVFQFNDAYGCPVQRVHGYSRDDLADGIGRVLPWMRTRLVMSYARVMDSVRRELGLVPRGSGIQEWILPPLGGDGRRVKADVRQWALRRGFVAPEHSDRLDSNLMADIVYAVLHDLGIEVCRVVTMYWEVIINLDDDVIENGRLSPAYPATIQTIIASGRLPDDPDPYQIAFRDLREEIRGLNGDWMLPLFAQCVATSLTGWLREQQWRLDGAFPSFDDYLTYATDNGLIEGALLLSRLTPGGIPRSITAPTELVHLERVTGTLCRLTNDAVGALREARQGSASVFVVIMNQYGLSPVQSATFLIGVIDSMLITHASLGALVRRSPAHQPYAQRHVDLADRMLCGAYAWELSTIRQEATDSLAPVPILDPT